MSKADRICRRCTQVAEGEFLLLLMPRHHASRRHQDHHLRLLLRRAPSPRPAHLLGENRQGVPRVLLGPLLEDVGGLAKALPGMWEGCFLLGNRYSRSGNSSKYGET